jgi:hypothetical protein
MDDKPLKIDYKFTPNKYFYHFKLFIFKDIESSKILLRKFQF